MRYKFLLLIFLGFLLISGCLTMDINQNVSSSGEVTGSILFYGAAIKSGYITCGQLVSQWSLSTNDCEEIDSSTIKVTGLAFDKDKFPVVIKSLNGGKEYTYQFNLNNALEEGDYSNYLKYVTCNLVVEMPSEIQETNGKLINKNSVKFSDVFNMSEQPYVKSFSKNLGCIPGAILLISLFLAFFVKLEGNL